MTDVVINSNDILSLLTEDPEKVIYDDTKLSIAKAMVEDLGLNAVSSEIVDHYTTSGFQEFKDNHEVAYNLFTRIFGEALWADYKKGGD